jgi:hypothetical protein
MSWNAGVYFETQSESRRKEQILKLISCCPDMKISGSETAAEVYDTVSQPVERVQLVGHEVPFLAYITFFVGKK